MLSFIYILIEGGSNYTILMLHFYYYSVILPTTEISYHSLFFKNNFILLHFTLDSKTNATPPHVHLILSICVKLIAWEHHIHRLPSFCKVSELLLSGPSYETKYPSSPISFSRLLALASFARGLLPTILDTLSTDIRRSLICFPNLFHMCCFLPSLFRH